MVQKTVVIAIEAPDVLDRFLIALQETDHRALAVKQLPELLDTLASQTIDIDLMVLDARLSGSGHESDHDEGIQLVRKIRRVAPQVPIIVLSGSIRSATEVRELADLGIARYINEHTAVQHILPSLVPLLFPDSFDRRTTSRVTLDTPASLRSGDTIVAVLMINVSKSGVAIRTMNSLSVGTKVTVRFRLPQSKKYVEVASRVVWSDRTAGVGLQFEDIGMSDQSVVDAFIDARLS